MFELTFLGTSASAPSVARNVSATLLTYREYRFLIDAGEGTQRQLLKSGLGFRKLERVLLTHAHLDHILGLAGMVSTLNRWDVEQERLQIYGSRQTLNRVRDLLLGVVLKGQKGGMWLEFIEVGDGPFFEDKHFTITAFPVQHRGSESVGYCFQEKSRRPFLNDKAEALKVPFGPERSRLVAGESITTADGRTIHPDEVLGPIEEGIKLVYIGDVDNVTPLLPIVADADALIIEATYADAEEEMMASHGHITARIAAGLAKSGNVGGLYLNHISRRYHGSELEIEARQVFPATTVVKDFDTILVKRKSLEG
jgi:ribonuclease Z